MIFVAVLLLPLLAGMLLVTDRLEERLLKPPEKPRHAARKRHLRLIRGGHADAEPRRAHAAADATDARGLGVGARGRRAA